ncbi:UNVERIFIED_CONTAM: Catenin alpha-2 [Gekko kuhli]
MPRFAEQVEVAIEALSANIPQPFEENEFIDASRLVYDGVRDIRKAVLMIRSDLGGKSFLASSSCSCLNDLIYPRIPSPSAFETPEELEDDSDFEQEDYDVRSRTSVQTEDDQLIAGQSARVSAKSRQGINATPISRRGDVGLRADPANTTSRRPWVADYSSRSRSMGS